MTDSFNEEVKRQQVKWRHENVAFTARGESHRRSQNWILPADLWEQGLWPGIRSGSANSLPTYIKQCKIQKHRDAHNLKSSWVLAANLYFPFGGSKQGRELLAGFLRSVCDAGIEFVDAVELEYAEGGAHHPSALLGEVGGSRGAGQTSPDVAFLLNGGRGLVLTESKFTEKSFYPCSARTEEGRPGRPANPHPSRCKNALRVLDDPVGQCHQVTWGRKYWQHLGPVIRRDMLSSLSCCPASEAGYQLFRQQALAEALCEKYPLVVSAVALDARNTTLSKSLEATGINDIRQWGGLFASRSKYRVFYHQDWVAWVRANDPDGHWRGWLTYVEDRYGYRPAGQ